MKTPIHFYHIGANGNLAVLERILAEHFDLLGSVDFPGRYCYGIVGPKEAREQVKGLLDDNGDVIVEADEGFEQVTLSWMHDRCKKTLSPDTPILYTHTKGAWNNSVFQDRWRREMDELLISPWPLRVAQLTQFDALGLHWLTPADGSAVVNSFFGGNFWWANAGFLAGLPELDWSERHGAEGWIGRGKPEVANLRPGWPVY